MAVFTDLSDNDRDEIAAAYGMNLLTSVIGIADGDTETTYLFRSQRGEFIVTLFENGAEPFDLEWAFRTMETLSAGGIPCPKTLRTETGDATMQVSGKLVAVVSFVPGSQSTCANAAKCADLGRRAGQIHKKLMRPSGHRPAPSLPRGPIHGALCPENVFFLGDTISGIINFRMRHDDVLITELAQILVRWAMLDSGALDAVLARAVLDGYCGIRPLEDDELRALPCFVMAAAATLLAETPGDADLPERARNAFVSMQHLLPLDQAVVGVA